MSAVNLRIKSILDKLAILKRRLVQLEEEREALLQLLAEKERQSRPTGQVREWDEEIKAIKEEVDEVIDLIERGDYE